MIQRNTRYFRLSMRHMQRIQLFFPKVRGRARSDGCKVLSGIIYVKRYGLRWQAAPAGYGPYKTLYNRFSRWSQMALARVFHAFAKPGVQNDTLMMDSTFLKAHRIAASLRKRGIVCGRSDVRQAA
jgi:transposase